MKRGRSAKRKSIKKIKLYLEQLMNFKGRSAKRFIANSTNNLKKAWAVQRAAKKVRLKLEEKMEKKERPLPMTKEERAEWAKNLLSGMGISREQVQEQIKSVPRIKSNTLVETIYGYKRVKEAL